MRPVRPLHGLAGDVNHTVDRLSVSSYRMGVLPARLDRKTLELPQTFGIGDGECDVVDTRT